MIICIKKSLGEALGQKNLTPFGISKECWNWKGQATINLAHLSGKKLNELEKFLRSRETLTGVKVLLNDIAAWRGALAGDILQRARTVHQFESLLCRFLLQVPGPRIYERFGESAWLPYHVNDIEYRPEETGRDRTIPAHVNIELIWEEFGGKDDKREVFYAEDIRSLTIPEALARKGYYPETPLLRKAYLAEKERFNEIAPQIGKQFFAIGTGVDDLDGNPDSERGYWHNTHTVQLAANGGPSRVVIDVYHEDLKTDREDRNAARVDPWFWKNKAIGASTSKDEDEDEDTPLTPEKFSEEANDTVPEIEVPVHVFAAVFDLAKHLRLRVHINCLTEYVYDRQLVDKLILPRELKELVTLLIKHRAGAFQDIIKGKAGGATVLLAGPPGTGKTLTAEVYAETEGRALYSIQCSQLGVKPQELEDKLLKSFERTRRWNAVMLLDEADVYVHQRGSDLVQNAIVGVFLRVLEYQSSVLFLTTNRPRDVDDAIASRCVARLVYPVPLPAEQEKIWEVLAGLSNIKLPLKTIKDIVSKNEGLTGRDVKNLLKLAQLTVGERSITAADIEFVKQFKPTGVAEEKSVK